MNEIKEHLKAYHSELVSIVKKGDFNEHTFRTPLENLLNALKPKDIRLAHEPKAEQGQGSVRPDFKIYKQTPHYEALQGFIECKNYKENLDTLIKGKQIEKYLAVCPNIILTDYNRFILLSFGKVIADITLFPFGLENTLFTQEKAKDIEIQNAFIQLLQSFFESVANITNKDELVAILSTQSFYLSETIFKSDEAGLLNTQFKESFEKAFATFASLENTPFSKIEFCDILAQSVVYGMFVAYIENDEFEIDKIPIQSFIQLLPQHFLTLQEFVYYSLPFFALPENIKYALENVKKTIALIDKPSLATSFEKEIQSLSIYLYEDFLKAYDTLRGEQRRKEGGVFYTPQPVVNMIVSSLNELLQSKFDKKGFNDESVKVLDFATGTGSFLAKVFELILANESEVFAKELIINKCLKDIYGFELSFVPYIVAHLKLSSILRQKGFSDLNLTHKFQIFLTNTLDLDGDKQIQMQVPFDSLKGQRDEALKLKRQEDLLVILGNPPYNVKSKNKGDDILKLLQSYKQGLNETNIQPLDDDYIKFIRFAQWKLLEQNQKQGLMGFITNNSYLSGPTHRKMREYLAKAFDEIYIFNLHGNADIDTNDDKNVFDIAEGVCVSLFIKYKDTHNDANLGKIFYYSTSDNQIFTRKDKFSLLNSIADNGLHSIKWQELKLDKPYFWFVPKTFKNDEYKKFWALANNKDLKESRVIFEYCGSGNKAERKQIIHLTKNSILIMIDDFINLEIETIRQKYGLSKDSRDWSIERAKADVIANVDCHDSANAESRNDKAPVIANEVKQSIENKITQIAYRPFDTRYTFFTGKSKGFWGTPSSLSKHFLIGENLGLCTAKSTEQDYFQYGFVVDKLVDVNISGQLSNSDMFMPLYLYQDSEKEVGKISKIPNFTPEFKEFIIKSKVLKDKSVEQILAFIYANLFNPAYRKKYLEYLKIGFPRVNFEVSESEFETFAKIGQRLIDLHLLKNIPNDESIALKFSDKADKQKPNFTLEKPRFIDDKIILNDDLEIVGIAKSIFEFSIVGYKVLDKWLKYRVGKALSKAELEHLVNVACIIKETIKIQNELENLAKKDKK